MKKILFAIALVMTMVLNASAQRDGFFSGWDNANYNGDRELPGIGLPNGVDMSSDPTNEDPSAPLGTGLLIMTALGGAYLLNKREK